MKITFSTKLYFGFILSSFLTAAVAFLCDYLNYFGTFRTLVSQWLFLGLFSLLFGFFFGYAYGLYLTRTIKSLTDATSIISKGDLRYKIPVTSEDELGLLAQTFNQMVESLVQMLEEVKRVSNTVYDYAVNVSTTSEEMKASAREIATTISSIANGAEVQAKRAAQTHNVTKDLAESIGFIAEKADAANRLAQQMAAKAQEGNTHTQLAVQRITEVAEKMGNAADLVQGFHARTSEIDNAVRHITSIAQQTQLLALNATIEAARAGEHGRGFAVVAEEVRKLSQETGKLAGQISQLADNINLGSLKVLESMSDSNSSATQSKDVVHSASHALQEIVKDVKCSADQVQEITRLTREQSISAAKLVEAIEEIASIAGDNAVGTEQATTATREQTMAMQELAEAAQQLSHTSDRLKSRVSAFQY